MRITEPLASAARTAIAGSTSPHARPSHDVGDLDISTPLSSMSLVFARSPEQEADLHTLLAAQGNRASPLYHAFLTPEQFALRFGMSQTDLATAKAWLAAQGFTVLGVNRSQNRIQFSGTAAQAETAFGVALHNFRYGTQTHFAATGEVSLPAPLAAVTQNITGLSSFRPHSHLRMEPQAPTPSGHFTSGQTGTHYLTPADVKTVYDINPAYTAGYTGAGQSIVVVGQSAVALSDIEAFQTAAGLTVKDPTVILVPNSGTSTVYTNDEGESDLDLEYSGGIATGATIKFVYVGSTETTSVVDSEAYAVDNDLGQIISTSYGECEADMAATDYASQNAVFEQAVAQGQTVVSAAGDDGSSDCAYENYDNTQPDNISGLYVDYPSSSQYVLGMGGTEFPSADVASGNTTYWTAANGSDVVSSALSYIPEQAWNDSTSSQLSAGGGGTSMYTARPAWQTGVAGIVSGANRLVPDLALTASSENAGYLYCSSDTSTEITGSCTHGFLDASDTDLTVAGGTSFAAPIFSGMLALINQAQGAGTGQGLVNSTIYTLAANTSTYASAFHDITSGNNACPATYPYCSSAAAESYNATTGYDEATGLGSVDLFKLLTAWTAGSSSTANLVASTTTLSPATSTPNSGASDAITITVSSGSSSSTTTPTGTVTVVVDGTATNAPLTLTGGATSYTYSSSTTGTHTVTATYSGDSVYASSTASITLTIPSTTTANSSFTLAATNVTVTAGGTGTSTVTVTPVDGYTGTVDWTIASSSALANACYAINNTAVTGASPVTTTLTVFTSASSCTSQTPLSQSGSRRLSFHSATQTTASAARPAGRGSGRSSGGEILLSTVVLCGLAGLRSRRLRPLAAILVVASVGLAISGCGSGVNAVSTNAPAGTYTLTLTGTDSSTSTLKTTATVTLTIQ